MESSVREVFPDQAQLLQEMVAAGHLVESGVPGGVRPPARRSRTFAAR